MATYHVGGFRRSNHEHHVSILIDADMNSNKGDIAAKIVADDDICFHWSCNVTEDVPASAKGILFNSEAELFAKVPPLDPVWRRKQRMAAKRQQRKAATS